MTDNDMLDPTEGSEESESQSSQDVMADHFHVEELIAQHGDNLPTEQSEVVSMLRTFPGAEAYDDETLLSMWAETQGEMQTEDETPAWKPDKYNVLFDDKPVEDFSDLDVVKLLQEGKFSYKALGKEQIKTFEEVIRNAQLGHFNQQRYDNLNSDMRIMGQKYSELEEKYSQLQELEQQWYAALANPQLYQQLQQEYMKNLGQIPETSTTVETPEQLEAQGMHFFETEIRPYLNQVASAYGVEPNSLVNFVTEQLEAIPTALLDETRLAKYLQQDLLMELEANGFSPQQEGEAASENIDTSTQTPAETEELKRELAALREQMKNLQQQQSVSKKRRAPSGKKAAANAKGDADELDFKSAAEFKEWLRS